MNIFKSYQLFVQNSSFCSQVLLFIHYCTLVYWLVDYKYREFTIKGHLNRTYHLLHKSNIWPQDFEIKLLGNIPRSRLSSSHKLISQINATPLLGEHKTSAESSKHFLHPESHHLSELGDFNLKPPSLWRTTVDRPYDIRQLLHKIQAGFTAFISDSDWRDGTLTTTFSYCKDLKFFSVFCSTWQFKSKAVYTFS